MSGRGSRALVFCHGFGLDQTSWRFVTPGFEADFRIVTFDHVGSGRSNRSAYDAARYASLEGYARDLLELLDALEIERCELVGASISGMIGLLAALREPARFASLALIGSSARYVDDPPDYHGGFQRADVTGFLQLMDENFIGWASNLACLAIKDSDMASELQDGLSAIDPRIARQLAELTFLCDFRASLPRCTQPVLVVQASDDAVVPLSAAEYLAKHLPHATLRVLRASSHCPQLTHPELVGRLLRDYLQTSKEQQGEPTGAGAL